MQRKRDLLEAEAYQALSSKSRLDILKMLYRKSMDVEELAEELGLKPITVRHHLQSLQEAGFVEAFEARAGTVGRPKVYYKIVREPALVGFPRRQYLYLSSFLINSLLSLLGESETKKILRKAGLDMGESTIKRLQFEHEIKDWSPKIFEKFLVNGYITQMGAEPEVVEVNDKKITYRLHNCIFFELSSKMPEIMCDVLHENFYKGLASTMGREVKFSRSTCMAKGDQYCEHSCEWLT